MSIVFKQLVNHKLGMMLVHFMFMAAFTHAVIFTLFAVPYCKVMTVTVIDKATAIT